MFTPPESATPEDLGEDLCSLEGSEEDIIPVLRDLMPKQMAALEGLADRSRKDWACQQELQCYRRLIAIIVERKYDPCNRISVYLRQLDALRERLKKFGPQQKLRTERAQWQALEAQVIELITETADEIDPEMRRLRLRREFDRKAEVMWLQKKFKSEQKQQVAKIKKNEQRNRRRAATRAEKDAMQREAREAVNALGKRRAGEVDWKDLSDAELKAIMEKDNARLDQPTDAPPE